MTAAVDRLEERGFIERRSSSSDRRARVLVLTPKGRQVAQSAFKSHASDVDSLMSALSDEEKEQLYQGLKKIGLLAAETLQDPKRKKPGPKTSSIKRNRKEKQS
jgi:DNA-binding MarR family transcriptional regulator